jgi:hypothetical protein
MPLQLHLAATGTSATGCWIWCAGAPTRAMSKNCCSIPLPTTARRCVSGSARDPGQVGKSQSFHLVRALTVAPAPESGDRLTRFGPFSSQCRAGNVKIRRGPWNENLFRIQGSAAGVDLIVIGEIGEAFEAPPVSEGR